MMINSQSILITFLLIPLINIFSLEIFSEKRIIQQKINNISCYLSLIFSLSLLFLNKQNSHDLVLFKVNQDLIMSFSTNKESLTILVILNIAWLLFTSYLQKFLNITNQDFSSKFLKNLGQIILALTALILSNNLLTIIITFQIIIVIFYFYSNNFLHKNNISHLFNILLFLESLLLLIVTIYCYNKFNSFNIIEITNQFSTLTKTQQLILSTSFIICLIAFIIFPFYVFYQKINLNPIIILPAFFFLFFFSQAILIIKIHSFILANISFDKNIFLIIEIVFLLNLILTSFFLIFSKRIKSAIFFLIFQQILLILFSTIELLYFGIELYFLPIISGIFTILLMSFSYSNIILYFENAKNKKYLTIFFDLKFNIIFLTIAILNMSLLLPGSGLQILLLLANNIIKNQLVISPIIYFLNFFVLTIFFIKNILPFFLKSKIAHKFIQDEELAKKIENSFRLKIPAVICLIIILIIPIISNLIK